MVLEREGMARCVGTWHDQGEIATRACTVQPRKLPSQGKLWRKTPSPRRIGSRFPLDYAAALFFWNLFFLFLTTFLLSLILFPFSSFSFFDLPHQGIGMGVTERRQRDGCAHEVADGWATEMKLGLQEKMDQKVENTSNQQQLNA
jgi:hypothetical protein